MTFRLVMCLVFFVISSRIQAMPCDSIGIIYVKDKKMILHEVKKETLYAISRKYNIGIDLITKANPELEKGLKMGMKILIPYSGMQNMAFNDQYALHTIEPNQTLYFISKKYKVSVEDIKKWNNMPTTEMKVGSTIIVGEKIPVLKEHINLEKYSEILPAEVTKTDQNKSNIAQPIQTVKVNKSDKIVEKGNAEVFERNDGNTFYYALHKTAPIGTIMQILNDANSNSIFVRVIGKLSGEGDSKTVVKLTKIAFESLQADNNFKATLEYLQ